MSDYQAPVKDMRFALNQLAGLDRIAALPGFEDATPAGFAARQEPEADQTIQNSTKNCAVYGAQRR